MATEQLLNGRYRLLRPLGAGGMASVYLAEDLRLGRRVAVKILHPQFAADPAFVARFDAEARTVASLSHPNIVQVYDVGHDGDRYYIVMEYVEGETLKDAITRDGPFAAKRALRVIGSVLAALDFAHAHNLVHRDIKSQNVLLTPTGDVKVADFGIARAVDGAGGSTMTATNMVIGTVQYFSPEQAQGRPATPQSDVYAAGIVLFEMLTGALPFAADNPLAVAMQQINQAPPLPTRLNRAIPAAVEAIVLKAMAKNPSERYTGASAMKAAVDGVLAGATESTRMTPRAAPPPQATTTRQQAATRTTRAAPVVNVAPRTAAPPSRPGSRNLWLAIVALALVLVALLGILFHNGAFAGFGGVGTPTPTVAASPTTTLTAAATVPVVVPQPTRTAKPTSPPSTNTPAATDTPTPAVTDTPATTDTPTPRDTATDTPGPTDTTSPTETPVPSATPVPTATTTATPAPSTTPDATGTAQASGQGQGQPGTVNVDPASIHPGDSFMVSGDSWPPRATLTITAAFDNGMAQLDQVKAHGDGTFSSHLLQLDPSTTPGDYIITVTDDQGDSQTSRLTVTQ